MKNKKIGVLLLSIFSSILGSIFKIKKDTYGDVFLFIGIILFIVFIIMYFKNEKR